MKISLQNKCAMILILSGTAMVLITFWTTLSILGMLLAAGGLGIFLIYHEKKWIDSKYLKNGLIFTLLFAIIYGFLEYFFFDATWNYWLKISAWFPSKYLYWVFMASLNFTLVLITSRKSLALSFLSVPLYSVNEDLFYWIAKSIHNGKYVFPVPNWFDQRFPIFGLGEPIPFFPFWPRFYFIGWILITILLYIQFKNLEGKKFLIVSGIFCICSLFSLLLMPPSYCKLISNLFYFFHKLQQQILFK